MSGLTSAETRQVRTGLGTYLFELGSALSLGGQQSAAREKFIAAAGVFPAFHSRLKARAGALVGRPLVRLLQYLAQRRRGVVR